VLPAPQSTPSSSMLHMPSVLYALCTIHHGWPTQPNLTGAGPVYAATLFVYYVTQLVATVYKNNREKSFSALLHDFEVSANMEQSFYLLVTTY